MLKENVCALIKGSNSFAVDYTDTRTFQLQTSIQQLTSGQTEREAILHYKGV